MEIDNRIMPVQIAKLIAGFFTHQNTISEEEQLDEWICASEDNMKIFEDLLEIYDPLPPKQGIIIKLKI